MKKIKAFLLLLALGALTSACGGTAGEYCDLFCDCEGCNDREYDACLVNFEAQIDTAEAYGCDDELVDYEDCVLERADCDGDDFEVDADCFDEVAELAECISDNSRIF
ncbi:MAG TPA: hypothetical protein VLS89_17440 [Candidatus Nanopelagicales bacterium]|nr:hypothetical protein [Candidatus Nanopelagicales bacterium]